MVRFTLKQLAYFAAVGQCGGIAQAARELNMSQPAVASAVDKLEQELGIRLLTRSHARGAELTAQGREVLALATRMLAYSEEIGRGFQRIAAELTGHLRLGCFQTLAPFYVPGLVKAVRARHPGVTLDVMEGRHDQLVSALAERRVDVALMYAMDLDKKQLAWETVQQLHAYLLLPESHPLTVERKVSLASLAGEPYVMFDWPGSREHFAAILRRARIDPPIAFRSQSYELVRSAVANGLGFSLSYVQPKTDVTYDGRRVVRRAIEERLPPLDMILAWSREAPRSPLRENLVQVARSYFAEQDAP